MMDHIANFIREQFENKFLTGGMALTIFMGVLALLRNVPGHLLQIAKRRLITTIDLADHDESFYWIQKWLSEHEYTATRARLLTVSTRTSPVLGFGQGSPLNKESDEPTDRRKRRLTSVIFSPAPGLHLIRFRGHFVLITKTRKESDGTFGELVYRESIIFQSFSKSVIKDLIFEAREAFFPIGDNRIAILKPDFSYWKIVQRRLPRSLDSVVLDGETTMEIVNDLKWFYGSADWYEEKSIPYQRGYILAGPPGNGKTSLVTAIASMLERDIYMFSLAGIGDAYLASLISMLPRQAILLIEDIDKIFSGREKTTDTNEKLTFSGFINAIDGVTAPPGRVLFMTTNHLDLIDPALKRPGRADRTFILGNATPDMGRRLFLRFFPDRPGLAAEFEKALKHASKNWSMAELQEVLIKNLLSPIHAIEEIIESHNRTQASA
jgi:chaperone BCS1